MGKKSKKNNASKIPSFIQKKLKYNKKKNIYYLNLTKLNKTKKLLNITQVKQIENKKKNINTYITITNIEQLNQNSIFFTKTINFRLINFFDKTVLFFLI